MGNEEKMVGFCPLCMQNVEHTRKFSSWIMFLLDRLTLKIAKVFRFGPFYCFQCETKRLYLKSIDRDAPTFNTLTSAVVYRDERGRTRKVDRESDLGELATEGTSVESAGNFIKSEQSLLMQERRLKNYSQKFRDAAVMKILDGSDTIQEVRRELKLTDSDVARWIADIMNRKQQRIDNLESILQSLQSQLPKKLQPIVDSLNSAHSADEGPVLEGKVAEK